MNKIPLYFNNKLFSPTVLRSIKVAISISLICYIGIVFDWNKLGLINYDFIIYLLISTFLLGIALSLMSLRWKLILNRECEHKIFYSKLLSVYFIGSFFSTFLPSSIGGDVVRIIYCKEQTKISPSRATKIVISERLYGLSSLCFIFSLGLTYSDIALSHLSQELVIYLLFISLVVSLLIHISSTFLLYKKITFNFRTDLVIWILSMSGQFLDIIIAYMFAKYLSINISIYDLALIMPIVYIVTLLPFSIGGIGVREGSLAYLLSLNGVDTSTAILFAFTIYLSKITCGFIGGIIYNYKSPISKNHITTKS